MNLDLSEDDISPDDFTLPTDQDEEAKEAPAAIKMHFARSRRRTRKYPPGTGRIGSDHGEQAAALPPVAKVRHASNRAAQVSSAALGGGHLRDDLSERVAPRRDADFKAHGNQTQSFKKIMSLPCTMVQSANGRLGLLDLSRLHYVSHRLALGADGLKKLIELQVQLIGHSEFSDCSHLSVLQMPTLDFENEYINFRNVPTSKRFKGMDPTVRKHFERFEARIEQYRAETMAKVVRYTPIAERNAPPALAAAQAAESDALELPSLRSPLVRASGVHFGERLKSFKHPQNSGWPSSTDARGGECVDGVATCLDPEVDALDLPDQLAASLAAAALEMNNPALLRAGSKWRVMQSSVQAMTERWVDAEKVNRRLKGPMFRSRPPLIDAFSVQDVQALYHGLHDMSAVNTGVSVYIAKCKEFGTSASSKVLEQLGQEYADISHAALGDRGTEALALCLPVNTTIRVLNVKDNRISPTGVRHLLRAMMTRSGHIGGFGTFISTDREPVTSPISKLANPLKLFEPKSKDVVVDEAGAGELATAGPQPPPAALSIAVGAQAVPNHHAFVKSLTEDCAPGDIVGKAKRRLKQMKTGVDFNRGPPRNPAKDPNHAHPIEKLELSCNPICLAGAKCFGQVLNKSNVRNQFLVELVLDHCQIPDHGGHAIMEGLQGNSKLRSLCMRNNLLSTATAKALGTMLLQNTHIRRVDLSWNNIGPMGGAAIAVGISHNCTLEVLKVAWNGLEDEGMIPIATALTSNCGLKTLDISSTRTGAKSCVVMGEALRENSTLEDLFMNGNLIGQDGARHIMTGLNENKSLKCLGLQGSNTTRALPDSSVAEIGFIEANPEGSYSLELEDPSERIVAIQLCRIDRKSEGDLMKNIKLSGAPVKSCKGAKWPDSLPTRGLLECDFVRSKDAKAMPVLDAKKLEAFEAEFREPAMSEVAKLDMVNSFAPYSYLYASQIARLLKCFSVGDTTVSAAAILFSRCVDLEDGLSRIMEAMSGRDRHYFEISLGWNILFRGANPTGHYELNLSFMPHRMLAQRLKDQSMSEGDSLTWLNIMYEETTTIARWPESKGPPVEWGSFIPSTGVLSFDYVESTPAPPNAEPITDNDLTRVLVNKVGIQITFGKPEMPYPAEAWPDKVAELRRACCTFYVTCEQINTCVDCFGASPDRVEVVVALWGRCVDRNNIWTVLYALSPLEQGVVVHRLGAANCLHPQHCSIHWLLDTKSTSHYDTMLFFVKEALKDESMPNWWNIRLTGRLKAIQENANMLGLLTTDTPTPIVSMDILMADSFELLGGRPEAEMAAMSPGDRLDVRVRMSQQIETRHIREFSHCFPGALVSRTHTPAWATYNRIMECVMNVPPWQAAWNRQMRKLVRLVTRCGDLSGASPLEDLFNRCTDHSGWMDRRSFDKWAKQSGYASYEVAWYTKSFVAAVEESKGARAKGAGEDGISFDRFFELFMATPPASLRKASALECSVLVRRFIDRLKAAVLERRRAAKPQEV